jgi:hypothetical protein
MTDEVPWQIVLDSHFFRNKTIDVSGFKFAFVWLT